MTQHTIGNATLYLEDLVAVRKGDQGYAMIWLYLSLRGLLNAIQVQVFLVDLHPFMAAWDAVRNPPRPTHDPPRSLRDVVPDY